MTRLRSPRSLSLAVLLVLAACGGGDDGGSTGPAAKAPNAPSSLTAIANTNTQVTVSWVLPAGTVTEVKIGRALGAAAFVQLATQKPAGSSYSDAGLTASTAYRYQVQACNGTACSTFAEVAVSTPAVTGQTQLAIWSPALPPGLAGFAYNPSLRTSGGNSTQATWSIVSGALPAGVTMNADGAFSGIVGTVGTSQVRIRVRMGTETAERDFTIRVVAHDQTKYNITRMDIQPVPSNIEPHLAAALARWERIIVGDEHIDTIPANFFVRQSDCGGNGQATNGTFLDDIIILVNIGALPGSVLGQAGMCGIRYDNELPAISQLTLNSTQLASLVGTETLTNLIFHEIGHSLGFGILWFSDNLNLITSTACQSETDIGNPEFLGTSTIKEFTDARGVGNPPVENTGGLGTVCSHWRKSSFKTEVMTGFIEQVGTTQQVSRITIGSMDDIGYRVDYSAADTYVVPAVSPPGLRVSPWEGWIGQGGQ